RAAPWRAADLSTHASAAGLRLARRSSQEERDRSDRGALGMRQAPGAQRARPAAPLGPFEDHRAIAVRTVVLAAPVQPLARRADAGQALRVEAKVLGPKEPRGIVHRLGLMPLGGDKARVALAKQR